MDKSTPKWMDVSKDNPGKLINARAVQWTENYDLFQAENKVYPYWVGTVQAWCKDKH